MRRLITLIAALALALLSTAPVSATKPDPLNCDGTYTGGTYAYVSVEPGITCILNGVAVGGSVTVGGSATLITHGSNIGHHVNALGAATVKLIGTNVFGRVGIAQTSGKVFIGSGGCEDDPVAAASIDLDRNHGNIVICHVVVRDDVVVSDNDGQKAITVRGNRVGRDIDVSGNTERRVRIAGNHADGDLICRGNTPSAMRVGVNVVGGQKVGQCS